MTTTVEIFTSPDSPNSHKALKMAQKVAKSLDGVLMYEVNTITEAGAEYADELQIDNTPAFVINGKIAFVGVPKAEELKKILKDEIRNERYRNSYFF